jgi:hypothetical protein
VAISASEKVFLGVGLLNFAGALLYLGISYYFALTKMDLMLPYLKNSPSVMLRIHSLKLGLSGKMYVFAGISAVLMMPHRMIRIGGASAEDIANFPPDLRRKIIWLQWGGMTMLLIMSVLWLIIEFELIGSRRA